MKSGRALPLMIIALLAPASRAAAESESIPVPRDTVVLRRAGVPIQAPVAGSPRIRTLQPSVPTAAYSVELQQVARLQGLDAFYRTAVDISNNTTNAGVTATIQFSYNCTACPSGGFFRTEPFVLPLAGLDNFHFDDMVQELESRGRLVAGAFNGAVGTLLVTFDGLPSSFGWEGTVVARLYTRVDEADPSQGTIGYAFPASLFFESAYQTSVGIVRDTTPASLANGIQGSQRTNIGIRNTDVHAPPGSNRPVRLEISFYDPVTGNRVGNVLVADNLLPGEVRIIGNVFSLAAIPTNISECIVFVDLVSPGIVLPPAAQPSPTFEAFVVTIDNVTQDGSFYEMKCGDPGGTCGF